MRGSMFANFSQDVTEMHPLATKKSVLAVAVSTTQRAAGQSNEHGRQPRLQGFTLQGMENLGDFQHPLARFFHVFCFSLRRHAHIVRVTDPPGHFIYRKPVRFAAYLSYDFHKNLLASESEGVIIFLNMPMAG